MTAIEFDAEVTDGKITVPLVHRNELSGPVHVVLYPQMIASGRSKIDELLDHPLQIPGFRPLTRDETHERH